MNRGGKNRGGGLVVGVAPTTSKRRAISTHEKGRGGGSEAREHAGWCAVRCGAMRCNAMRCGAMRCGAMWCGAVRCGVVGSGVYGSVPCGEMRCGGEVSVVR